MQHRSLLKSLILCVAGAAALLCHDAIGAAFFDGYKLGIGSPLPQEERTRFTFFYAYWVVLGTGALVLLTSGLNRLGYRVDLWTRLAEWWREASERRWIAVVSILVLLFAILIRSQVLQGVPLTDDEEAYRFSAQVLASGHLTAQSLPEPLKLFFDRNQIINGGRWYSQYFLGWPALMVPGVWLGLTEWVNAFYAALTVFPLYQLVREYVGPNWAKAAVLLFAASPFLMVGAATLGSHTSCMMAATWATYFFSRASEVESPWWWHALFGGAFSVTFFIRPFTAVALGLPFLGLWAWRMVRGDSGVRWRAIAAFAIPAVAMAALFLTVNYLQNGGIFETAYGEYLRYAQGNDYRFSFFTTEDERVVPNLRFEDPLERLAIVGIGVFRLNSALFGWPASLVLLLVAPLRRRLGVWWASVGSYLAFHLLAHDPGIDTYGPVHYFELALPVLILSMAGLERLTRMGQRARSWNTNGRTAGAAGPRSPCRWPSCSPFTATGRSVSERSPEWPPTSIFRSEPSRP